MLLAQFTRLLIQPASYILPDLFDQSRPHRMNETFWKPGLPKHYLRNRDHGSRCSITHVSMQADTHLFLISHRHSSFFASSQMHQKHCALLSSSRRSISYSQSLSSPICWCCDLVMKGVNELTLDDGFVLSLNQSRELSEENCLARAFLVQPYKPGIVLFLQLTGPSLHPSHVKLLSNGRRQDLLPP